MARQIIILENQNPGRQATEPISYRYVFWLSVPAARRPFFANATATSAVKDATAPELVAIQNGSIKEFVSVFTAAPGTTAAQIQTHLVNKFTADQAVLNSAAANLWDRYGTFWDGATWSNSGVA